MMPHLEEGRASEISAFPKVTMQLWFGQHSLVQISSPKGSLKRKMPGFLPHRPNACLQEASPPRLLQL